MHGETRLAEQHVLTGLSNMCSFPIAGCSAYLT